MTESIFILAMSDTATWSMFAINLVLTLVVMIALFWIARALDARRDEMKALSLKVIEAESHRKRDVADLSDKLHDANTKLIDTRFRDVTHQVRDHAQAMTATMDAVTKRIATSEDRLSALGEARNEAQLKLSESISSLREFVREVAVSREEFSEVKTTLKELAITVSKVDRESISLEDLRKALREGK